MTEDAVLSIQWSNKAVELPPGSPSLAAAALRQRWAPECRLVMLTATASVTERGVGYTPVIYTYSK